jgi:uncharacterized low-complexity protein
MNNMPSNKSLISLALGSVFAATLGIAPVASADQSPFMTQSLNKGYMVAQGYDQTDGKTDGYGEKKDRKYGEGRCGMSMADTDNDGRVSKEEHARHCDLMFDKMDANKDGYIDKDEAKKMRMKHKHHHHHRPKEGYNSSDQSAIDAQYEAGWGGKNLQHMQPMDQY